MLTDLAANRDLLTKLLSSLPFVIGEGVSPIMLEDCICSMHRYLFPPSAGVHIISVGDDLEWPLTDDQCHFAVSISLADSVSVRDILSLAGLA